MWTARAAGASALFSPAVSKYHTSGRRRLPPLNALRAFEACARLGSTVAAAAELGVTHGAVSKQVALLERHLGVLLFDRGGARLAPTPLGLDYAAKLGQGFDLIDAASRESALGRRDTAKVVRVSTTASLAGLWLLPLLPEFQAAHPGIEVWVAETKALVAIGREAGADVALRTGMGPWPGVRAEALLTERLVPVAAPALARRLRKPRADAPAPCRALSQEPLAGRALRSGAGLGSGLLAGAAAARHTLEPRHAALRRVASRRGTARSRRTALVSGR